MRDFRQIAAWQKAHRFTLAACKACESFPATERFGLVRQIARAAASIGSNIAEGCGRGGDAELCRFFQIAMGSACEVEYQLLLARDLGYLNSAEHSKLQEDISEVQRMLAAFIRKLRADIREHSSRFVLNDLTQERANR